MKKFVVEYIRRESCPACSCFAEEAKAVGEIKAVNYRLGKHYVPAHGYTARTRVLLCPECGLYYKDHVPEPASLLRLFECSAGEVWNWNNRYDYESEIRIAQGLFPGKRPGVLDVGSSNGELLRSFSSFCSRLSALDVVRNPVCEKYVNDEFITGWLEEEQLSWSGRPYDLVTLFDVVEHLLHVSRGFKNLRELVRPGGYVLIETGDAESYLARRYGAGNWYYLNRIEHHVAFTRKSISKIAKMFGFTVTLSLRKRHKNVNTFSFFRIARSLAISAAYRVYPAGYLKVMDIIFERPIGQPRNPLEDDHMFITLRRDEEPDFVSWNLPRREAQ